MRILFLSQYFFPEPGASSIRVYELSQALMAAGHEVTIIAEVPNHPHGVIPEEFRGKVFQWREHEGAQVLHTWVKTSPQKSFRNRLLFYVSYMVTAVLGGLFAVRGRYDLIIATSPPLFTAVAGGMLSLLRRTPFLLDLRDLWPEAAVAVGELNNPRYVRWATSLEEWCYRRATRVTATAQEIIDRLQERGVPSDKLCLVRNGAKTTLFYPDPERGEALRETLGLQDRFVVLYAGLHGVAYDLVRLMDVAAELMAREPAVHFLLVGHGVIKEETQRRAAELNLTNVTFLPVQPREEIPPYFNAADILIVPMREPHIVGTLPLKIYDAMASELPVLVAATGETQMVVEGAQAGLAVRPEDKAAIRDGILQLHSADLGAFGRNGREAILNQYTIQKQAEIFVGVAETIVTKT